jgi:membrane-bound lytic murein transglycosylase B
MRLVNALSAAALVSSVLCAPALGATCNAAGGFDWFIAEFKKDAAAKGVSQDGLSALNGVTLDPAVLAADKRQGVFKETFEEFSGRMISRDRMTKGARLLQTHAATLRKVEAQYGVPGPVIVAIWGLETDFGVSVGKKEVIRSEPRH